MGKIKKVKAREILDSKGDPTVEVLVETGKGFFRGSCPSGVSTGEHEAIEVRDGEKRFGGRGVKKAVGNVEKVIAPKIEGLDPSSQKKVDEVLLELDPTPNKKKLGANSLLPVSIAVARAGAAEKGVELFKHLKEEFSLKGKGFPSPCFLIIEGGLHAGGNLSVQEFMVAFEGETLEEEIEKGVSFYKKAGERMRDRFGPRVLNTGLEGGLTPPFLNSEAAILELSDLLEEGKIVLDVAATHFFSPGKGVYNLEGKVLTREGLVKFYKELLERFPLLGIEDPFEEDDFSSWKKLNSFLKKEKKETILIGDDLTVTNKERVERALKEEAAGGLVVKPNQAGTVTETVETAAFAKKKGMTLFVKHRSGETNDTFIADLAVALSASFLMAGAPLRGERVAKYNRLLEIRRL